MKGSEEASALRTKILNGPAVKTIFWLAWPIVLANLVNISYNLVDAFWLGKLGREAFGAPTVSWPLIMLFYSLGMGYATAGISIISQYFGAGEFRLASKSAGQLVASILSLGLTLSILGYALSPSVLELMGVPKDIYPLAVSYIRTIFLGVPLVFLGYAFITIANAAGDTRTPTWLNITSALTNIVLDPLFIFGYLGLPKLGVVGAAVATVISRSILSIAGGYFLIKGFRGIKLSISDLRIEGWWVKKIFKIGTPLTLQQSSNALGFTVMTSLVSRFGSVAVAAYGAVIRVVDIMQAFTWGISRATSIMVGQNIGAENYDRAKKVAYISSAITATILSIGALGIWLAREWVISVFISDVAVVAEGAKLISAITPSLPFFALFFVAGAVAGGSGHTSFFAFLSILRLWVLRIGLSYVLALNLGLGVWGIWLAMSISNVVSGSLSLAWLAKGNWLRRVIEIPKPKIGSLKVKLSP